MTTNKITGILDHNGELANGRLEIRESETKRWVAEVSVSGGIADLPIQPNTKYDIEFYIGTWSAWSSYNYVWESTEPYLDGLSNYCYTERP